MYADITDPYIFPTNPSVALTTVTASMLVAAGEYFIPPNTDVRYLKNSRYIGYSDIIGLLICHPCLKCNVVTYPLGYYTLPMD